MYRIVFYLLIISIPLLVTAQEKQDFFEKGFVTSDQDQIETVESKDKSASTDSFDNSDKTVKFEDFTEEIKLALKKPLYLSAVIDCSNAELFKENLNKILDLQKKLKIDNYMIYAINLYSSNNQYLKASFDALNEIDTPAELEEYFRNPEGFHSKVPTPPALQIKLDLQTFGLTDPNLTEPERMKTQTEVVKNMLSLTNKMIPVNALPEKYINIKKSPAWIIGTEQGEIIFEAVDNGNVASIIDKARTYKPHSAEGELGLGKTLNEAVIKTPIAPISTVTILKKEKPEPTTIKQKDEPGLENF